MRRSNQFDEVMIINPAPPGSDPATGERIMMNYGTPLFDGFGNYVGDAEELLGWYGQTYDPDDGMGAYADYADYAGFEDPGYYAAFADEDFGDDEMDGYALDGYQPSGPSRFNYRVGPRLSGYDAEDELDGYAPPSPVSPRVQSFNPLPAPNAELPDTLKPLW
jgi:hypothetical protein